VTGTSRVTWHIGVQGLSAIMTLHQESSGRDLAARRGEGEEKALV
jgi:hypothetical protein